MTADDMLDWTEDGAPRSRLYGDVYFSREDGLAESRAVFLAGCGLPEAWRGRRRFTVAELGFGTGLNIVALLDLWRRERPNGARLSIFSVEAHPLSAAEARRALAAWPEVAEIAQALLARWPAATPSFHRLDLPELNATLDLAVGDAAWALQAWSGPADAWMLDGFAPSTNPAMWSDAVMDAIAARSAPGASLATFTVAGAVRRGLAERGFTVDKRPGHGRKRERLEARAPGAPRQDRSIRVAVIGAGVAGLATARALKTLGAEPLLIEAVSPGAGASGFPAALVTPRLDAGDGGLAALFAQALARAGALYRDIPGAVAAEGVLQLASAERDGRRFAAVSAQPWWPAGAMRSLDVEAASDRLGEDAGGPGLAMDQALVVAPAAIRADWLSGLTPISGQVRALSPEEDAWRIELADQVLTADAVVIAAGWGSAALAPELALSPVAGQADWVRGVEPGTPVAWGGYAIPTAEGGLLWGATHDRGVDAPEVDTEARRRNLDGLRARLPGLAAKVAEREAGSRVAVRATTRDRLPVCGADPTRPGLHYLTGLGSRGFCLAPILGEHLAATILGAPSPLPANLIDRLAPSRFGG